jgi:23S rRNA (uracil1939-C5)-methyltransferase
VRISVGERAAAIEFIRESAKGALEKLEKTRPDVVLLNPPRDGCAEIIDLVARARPRRIIYVSCNPPKLARDISFLSGKGYRTLTAQALDMFPQTYHVEGIICLGEL